jgi:signal transduction histidine kinase
MTFEEQNRVFELISTRKKMKLGLYISKLIVEEFKGEINCKSIEGLGTTFTFSFQL